MKNITAELIKPGPLTPKESNVLRYLCEGFSRKEIARAVNRSESCISTQVESIASKLHCHSAAEIVATASALNMVNITIRKSESHYFEKIMIVFLVANILLGAGGPRPRAPRPLRTQNVARLVRASRQV